MKLAFVDLDDTLLGPDKEISEENFAALDRLRTDKIEVIVASGRHHLNILKFENQLKIKGWIVSSHGAVVRHSATNETLHALTLAPEEATKAFEFAEKQGLAAMVYHPAGVFAREVSEWTQLYARQANWKPEIADLLALGEEGVEKFIFSGEPGYIDEIEPYVRSIFGSRNYVVRSEKELLEILDPRVNKALGLAAVALRLGVEQRDIMAFGDGFNDVEMLRWAGLSVAMKHGREAARDAADFVSPDGDPATALARAIDLALEASAVR